MRLIEFRTAIVSILTVVVYLAIAITNEWQDAPRLPPDNLGGLDLPQAFQDLKTITTRPHPYNSRSNDDARSYILKRVNKIAENETYVHVVDDLVSNATYANARDVVYHEGLNVLVFINGTSPNLQSVLLSAHFDSVSTGYGATDDGMGVVSLLVLLEYFVKHPPKRNLVFNINNGEEDWLNGAHVFLEHPFSRNIGTFLNLEGAGSGGRPMLFRSSNTRVTKLFNASPHPHGNSISADAFKAGLIKSGTDYSVYEQDGMKGLDFAFYRHRDQYHTKYDDVSNLDGSAPLWNMVESALATAKALTEEEETSEDNSESVYFDVLGEGFVVVTLRTAFIINILLLTIGPLAALTLGIFASRASKLYWGWHGWIRFPIALVAALGLNAVLVFGYSKVNPYVGYSATRALLLSFSTLTVLSFYAVLRTAIQFYPIPCQRHIILIEYYAFWWILLVLDTIVLNQRKIGVLFPVAFFHGGALLAVIISLLEVFFFKPKTPNADLPQDIDDPNVETAIVVERAEPDLHSTNGDDDGNGEADEQTPLLITRRKVVGLKSEIYNEKQAGGMWIWQYLAAVPFPALFMIQVAFSLLYGMNGTLADGGSTTMLLILAAVSGFLIAFPLAAFVHKLHISVIAFITFLFISSTLYAFFVFPFSPTDPLKVFFKQTIDLDPRYPTNRVYLEGVESYLYRGVVEEIPSSTHSGGVWCSNKGIRAGVRSCRWSGALPRVGNGTALKDLVTFSAKRISGPEDAYGETPSWARFTVKGPQDTRACRIYFESSPVYAVRVHGASNGGVEQRGYEIAKGGASVVKLWSRTWDRTWVVDVDLGKNVSVTRGVGADDKVRGRVACEWSENVDSRIPALEEIITFVPKWAVVSKADDGLVEAYKSFEI